MKPWDLDSLTAVQVAALLGVTDRAVRKWIVDKDLPCNPGEGVKTMRWSSVLAWHDRLIREDAGTVGTPSRVTPSEQPQEPSELYEDALCRKTRAEADIKELQLAEMRRQVASIGDVEKVLTAANLATRTQIEALPSRLSQQLIAISDQGTIYGIVDREVSQLLTNLATIDDVLQAASQQDSE